MLFLLEIKVNMAVIRIMKCCEDLKEWIKEMVIGDMLKQME